MLSAPPQLVNSPPSTISSSPIATTRRLPTNSYMELHLSKLARSSNNAISVGHKPQIIHRGNLGTLIQAQSEKQILSQRPSIEEIYPTPRQNSLPEEASSRDPTRDTAFSVTVSVPSNEVLQKHLSAHDVQSPGEGGSGSPMSLTWPRSNLGSAVGSAGLGSVVPPPLNLKGSAQINADSVGVAGGKHRAVQCMVLE